MTTTISKSILSALLAHANPWGTRPESYGASAEGYNANARVASAGTTWQEIHAAGITLQSDTHDRYVGALKKHPDVEKDRANRNYRLAHGGVLAPDTRVNPGYRNPDGMYAVGAAGVDARVNPETSPSGLRPRIIKAHHKSDSLRTWHAALVQAVAAAPDGGQVQVPDLDNLAGLPSVSTGSPTTATRVAGPTGYKAFIALRDNLAVTISNLIQNLRSAEDLSVTGPAADAFTAWAFTAPTDTLAGVRPDHYDRDIIREGSVVVLIPGAKSAPAVGFMAKLSKLATVPETLTVSRLDGAVCYLTSAGFKKDLPVPMGEVRRYTPPAPVVAVAWKPSVGALASLGGIMVLVNAITETEANVTDEEGNDAEVSLADLTAPE